MASGFAQTRSTTAGVRLSSSFTELPTLVQRPRGDSPSHEFLSRWLSRDGVLPHASREPVFDRVAELTADPTLENYWVRFRLRLMALSDLSLPEYARTIFPRHCRAAQPERPDAQRREGDED